MKFILLIAGLVVALCAPAEARSHHHRHHVHHHYRHAMSYDSGSVVGGRPAGCPYQFCGCGASLYLFGRIVPELNLAWNWARKFPRIAMSEAGHGDAAVRAHHVAVVLQNLGNGNFLLHDSNSGGHLTRDHVRHLAGYVFVRPHG